MDTAQRNRTVVQDLVDRHFAIWNDTDANQRLARQAGVYTPGIFVADDGGMTVGFAEVNHKITEVQNQHPGFIFRPAPASWNHGIGRVTWGYGPAGAPDQVRGEDIFTIEDGKIASLHVFIDQ